MTMSLQEEINKATLAVKEKYENTAYSKRYPHILGVAETAKKLAKQYNENEDLAYLAGILHDYYRYEDNSELAKLLTKEEASECLECPILYHGYASSHYYLDNIGSNQDVVNAIKNHTFGRVPMSKLEEIVLISDYVEPTRKYENCIKCRGLVERGLFYTAIYESTRHTIEYIKTKGETPHPNQVKVLEYYKEKMVLELLDLIKEALNKVRATEIETYDCKEVTPFYDYIVLATVSSTRQSDAVKGYLEEYLVDTPYSIRTIEGEGTSWVLIDLNQVIVSVLTKEERERLDLDKLYSYLK